jgi:hypothetical protein
MNKRLNMITTLVELINLHMDGYSYPRRGRRPKFSIHGKDQNIKVKIQIHENQVGELVLYDPRTDADYDNPSVSARGHHGPDLHSNNWPEEIKKLSFNRHEEGRDYWAALDIVHLMAMHGFRVQAYGSSMSHLYIGGQLLPDSTDQYGRFSFWMNVTTAYGYWGRNETLKDDPVTIPTLPELTEAQRYAGKSEGIVREMPKGGYYEGIKKGTPIPTDYLMFLDAAGNPILADDEELLHGTIIKKGVETGRTSMATPNPMSGITKAALTLPPNACIEMDPLTKEECIQLADGFLDKVANTRGLSIGIAALDPGVEATFAMPDGSTWALHRSKKRPDSVTVSDKHYDMLFDPLTFGTAEFKPDPISHVDVVDAAGNRVDVMAVPQRRLFKGCDVIAEGTYDSGTDDPELQGMLREQLDAHFAAKNTAGLANDAQYPEMLGMTREELDDPLEAKAVSDVRLSDAEVTELADAYHHVVVGEFLPNAYGVPKGTVEEMGRIRERFINGSIAGAEIMVIETPNDAFDRNDPDLSKYEHLPTATQALLKRETRWATHVLSDNPHDVPTTDLDLEADPANWGGFLDDDSAAAPRSEDGGKGE